MMRSLSNQTVQAEIAQRQSAAEALRESEAMYRSLFENMLNGFAYCRMFFDQDKPQDFMYLSVNSAFETLTGLKDVVGKKVSEVIPGLRERDPGLFEIYGRVALTGVPHRFETYVEAMGMWFSIAVYSPRKEHFVAVFDVITARKRAEAAMRESASKERTILATVQAGVVIIDTDTHTIVDINPAAAKLIGETKERLVGSVCHRHICPAEAGKCPITDLKQTVDNAERVLLNADGTRIPIIKTVVPITLSGRQCLIESFVDITSLKRTEEKLACLNQQRELILNSAAEGILGLDLQGDHTFVNPAAARMLGYEAEELIGRPSHSTWHHTKPDGSPCPREECQIYGAYRDGVARHVTDEVFWRKDGTSFPVEYASTPIFDQGRLAGAVVTFADITERKRAEEKIRIQLEELQRWQDVMLGREDCVQETKREVNDLCRRLGEPLRYSSQEASLTDYGGGSASN